MFGKMSPEDIKGSIIVLTLYIMQGFALGVVMCVSMVLNSMGVKMEAQALFSFAFYPFVFKILWAPIVDSISFGKFGLRKPWIVLAQTTVAVLFFATSFCFETLVEVDEVKMTFLIFFGRMEKLRS
jgi:PAT family acetyl-CoA transporter-like MFS transporter 1